MSEDHSSAGASVTETDRAVGLFTFLGEFVRLRTKAIRDISHYAKDGQVIWAAEIPKEHGCSCIAWHRETAEESADGSTDETWIEIRKPCLKRPPEPPESVHKWVRPEQLGDSSLAVPELFLSILGESVDDPSISLADNPDVQRDWDDYIEHHWWPWAERDRRERTILHVYTNLYSLFQRQQRERERFELVFGLGFLCWIPPDGQAVRRHLIAAQASVSLNAESGRLTVTPAGDGVPPAIEQDMLDSQYRPDPQQLRVIDKTLESIAGSVWKPGPIDGLLKSWVNSAARDGEYSDTLKRPERLTSSPVVHFSPALILRRRTERSFIDACEGIIEQLKAGEPVPECVSHFIRGAEDQRSIGLSSEGGKKAVGGETYFPLPANKEQFEILRRLNANRGVLVQGPPGTGKSHTIINLICHSLATGKRVLVTSHTVRALKVLRSMISKHAPDLAPLTVVQLGGGREAQNETARSVKGITTKQNTWSLEESRSRVSKLGQDLDSKRRRESEVLVDLRVIREQETTIVEMFGYSGTLAQIADELGRKRKSLSWVPDDIPEVVDPPLSMKEFDELIALEKNDSASRWEAGGWTRVKLDELPTIEEFEADVSAECEARATCEGEALIRERPEYIPLKAISKDDRKKLSDGFRDLGVLIGRIKGNPLPWTEESTKEIVAGATEKWKRLREDTLATAKSISESAQWLDEHSLDLKLSPDLPKLRAIRVDTYDLLQHLKADRGWGFWPFRPRAVKRALYLREFRIGGRPITTVDTVRELLRWVDDKIKVDQLCERWKSCHDFTSTTFVDFAGEFEDICKPIRDAFEALQIRNILSEILRRVPACPEPEWLDRVSLLRFVETLDAIESEIRYSETSVRIDLYLNNLDGRHRWVRLDPVSKQICDAVKERDTSEYAHAWTRATVNVVLAVLLDHKRELLKKLTDQAPRLAGEICETSAQPVWDERIEQFEKAWDWSRAHARLTRLTKSDAERRHREELDRIKRESARILSQIAAEEAWIHCFSRMTEHHRQHLVAWSKSVRAIGKGTGRYAYQHRLNAVKHLNECRPAIPAWVMPLHRVAEMTGQSGPEQFDLAIIDESSQSGPEALLLAWLARKLVVVGDDKQIRPTYAGVNFEDVNQLRERYITELPHADAYSVSHSFFDLAEIRYAARIRLREHFRCMPEIIEFSNRISYPDEPLVPLRQYGVGRLEPTIATRYVRDGYQNGTGASLMNPPEAEAIVQEIVRICRENAYDGKKIGVVSLVGHAQARAIERQLIARLGAEEIEKRQLVCGDAYAFQGDERDVMFLSLVSAPRDGRRIRAMTDADTQRRFNVAASRARDQLFLFHTATLEDLSPNCMRYQLLQYCLDPKGAILDSPDLAELKRSASQDIREIGNQPEPFGSWFELDVFLRIMRRGYRVTPQFEVGGYRIDLVVQGRDGSLAVECDGDHWHGPDRYEQDAVRQRDLERCGWTFWRVRESSFRFDPDEALKSLWETLNMHRICPGAGAVERCGQEEATGLPGKSIDTQSTEPRSIARPRTPVRAHSPVHSEESTGETTALRVLSKLAGSRYRGQLSLPADRHGSRPRVAGEDSASYKRDSPSVDR